jgi:MoaA/NifB/PqqE/SkfB family radical SAM enzyme
LSAKEAVISLIGVFERSSSDIGGTIGSGDAPGVVQITKSGRRFTLNLSDLSTVCRQRVTGSSSHLHGTRTIQALVCQDGYYFINCNNESSIDKESIRHEVFSVIDLYPEQPWLAVDLVVTEQTAYWITCTNAINLTWWYEVDPIAVGHFVPSIFSYLFPETSIVSNLTPLHRPIDPTHSIAALNRAQNDKMPSEWFFRPVAFDLEITQKCTLECEECAIIEDVKRGEFGLSSDYLQDLMEEAEQLGLYSYSITGGEPFIRFNEMCNLIAASRLDCFKIQTNATFFTKMQKGETIIADLLEAGLGSKNTKVSSTIQASVGIQNYDGGATVESIIHLARLMKPLITPDSKLNLALGLSITSQPNDSDARDLLYHWRRLLASEAGIDWQLDRAHIRVFPTNVTYKDGHDASQQYKPLKEHLVDASEGWGSCFIGTTTPWPRILVRATGEVYACSCFGHVFLLGSYPKTSLFSLVKQANEIPNFKTIYHDGVLGLLKKIDNERPGLGDIKVPTTTTMCQMCGIINGNRNPPSTSIYTTINSRRTALRSIIRSG